MPNTELNKRIISLKSRIVDNFTFENWEEVGLLTDTLDLITGHPRLFRSLSFGDDDYSYCVLQVLQEVSTKDTDLLAIVEDYLNEKFPPESVFVSSRSSTSVITFAPIVFDVPDTLVEPDLLAVMMPFASEFAGIHEAVKLAALSTGFRCLRADDIWDDSVIVQDIFNLIFRAQIVVVDFSHKNPNVMYETGIAHTLGKYVIPISQSLDDVPFDMRHHRVLKYFPNREGLGKLTQDLSVKLGQLSAISNELLSEPEEDEDEIPF